MTEMDLRNSAKLDVHMTIEPKWEGVIPQAGSIEAVQREQIETRLDMIADLVANQVERAVKEWLSSGGSIFAINIPSSWKFGGKR